MSEGYVEFSRIKEALISDDGEEVTLTCQGGDGLEFDMQIPANAIGQLVNQLMILWLSPQLKASESPEPPLLQVTDLEAQIYPNDVLVLTIQNQIGYKIRVGFVPEMTEKLFGLLLREGKFHGDEIQ